MLDASMRDELSYVTLLGPVICMSYVANHQLLHLLKQFKVLAKYSEVSDLEWKPPHIRLKSNNGNENQDFLKIYRKEHDLWEKAEIAEMYIMNTLKLHEPSNSGPTIEPKFSIIRG
ncbi:hypothetical protein L1987_86001 [Smallanthus sonchifolius]|uniref:Uncharacterized protein n=1 Tax=Smallanthus sonchifolius TaxID=185202 RepID=A0ACB8XY30_9ASTR|nr:hypothetical protein L1987_86001 [Smallanthus sonchifolius]